MFNIISAISAFNAMIIMLVCLGAALVYTIVASIRVKTVYAKYNRVESQSGFTAEHACRKILDSAGLQHIGIAGTPGNLTDHFDPTTNMIYLSDTTKTSRSIGAIGVAAHEAGHAIQYAEEYKPIHLRKIFVPVINFSSKFIFPLILITTIIELVFGYGNIVSMISLGILIGVYAIYMLFTLLTLPIEYNASSRAKKILREDGILSEQEVKGAAKVLGAAAQTYLASFALSLMQLLRLIMIFLSRRNSNK